MSEKGAGDPAEADEGFVLWEGWMFGAAATDVIVEPDAVWKSGADADTRFEVDVLRPTTE